MHWGPKRLLSISSDCERISCKTVDTFYSEHNNPETTLLPVISGASRFNKVHKVARLNDFIPIQVSWLGRRRSLVSTLCGSHDTEEEGNFTAGKSSHLVLNLDPPLQSQETILKLIFFLSFNANKHQTLRFKAELEPKSRWSKAQSPLRSVGALSNPLAQRISTAAVRSLMSARG